MEASTPLTQRSRRHRRAAHPHRNSEEPEFLRRDGRIFRRNQIWRRVIDRRTGVQVGEECVKDNCALVVYEPRAGTPIRDV